MKRFSKILAVMMVLTLVIGTVPAAAASEKQGTGVEQTADTHVEETVYNGVASSIRQTAYNAFEVTFIGGDANIDPKDVKPESVYWELRGAAVPFSAVKDVKCEGGVVNITMYSGFTPNREYKVNMGGTVLSFTAVPNDRSAVDKTVVYTTDAEVGIETAVEARMFTAGNVDITDSVKASSDIIWTLEAVDGDASCVDGDHFRVTFDDMGQEAVVQAVLSYYDEQLEDEVMVISDAVTITPFPAELIVITDVKYSIEASDNVGVNDLRNRTWLAMGDEAYLCGRLTYSDKQKTKKSFDGIGEEDGNTAYAYSCNENICMVTDLLTNKGFELTGVDTGTTAIIVAHKDDDEQEVIDAVCPVTVKEARVPSKISECTVSKTHLNVNRDDSDYDNVLLTVRVLDQYGEPFVNAPVTIEQTAATSDPAHGYPVVERYIAVGSQERGSYAWRIDARYIDSSSLTDEKHVKFDISIADTHLEKTVSVWMKNLDNDTVPDSYALYVDGKTSLESGPSPVRNSDTDYMSAVYVVGMKGQYVLQKQWANIVGEMPKRTTTYGSYDEGYEAGTGIYLTDAETRHRIGAADGCATAGAIALCVRVKYNSQTLGVSRFSFSGMVLCDQFESEDVNRTLTRFSSLIRNAAETEDAEPYTFYLIHSHDNGDHLPVGTYTFDLCAAVLGENGTTYIGGKQICDSTKITVKPDQYKVVPKFIKNTSSEVVNCTAGTQLWNSDAKGLVRDCWELKFSNLSAYGFTDGVRVNRVKYVKNNSATGKTSVYVYQAEITVLGWVGGTQWRKTYIVNLNRMITNED